MEDPLQGLSGLSLFPRTFALKPPHCDDFESTHNFMKSMELQSPHKYLEQAKTIVHNSKELPIPEFASFLNADNEHEAVAANGNETLRGRRPGLGRKKAQFTMIPNLSQPPSSSEPIKDAELSKDPREFFAYFERREMAEKELRRLRGESVSDVIDFNLPRPERHRRPGILGRTATYKHLYPSSTLPENSDISMPSQETLEEVLSSPVSRTSQPEEVNLDVELEKKLTGSIAMSESKIDTLFDELLGRKDLDGDEISALVLEHLQMKPIMDEIPIPVFQDSINELKSRTALSNIQNLPQVVSGKTITKDKQVAKSLSQSLLPSRSPISPFAPISAFQKHIQQSNLSNDRFSALDLSPLRNSSSLGEADEQSNRLDRRTELMASSSSKLKSVVPEVDDSTVHNLVSSEMIADGKVQRFDKSVNDQFDRSEEGNMTARSTDADIGVDVGHEVLKNVDDIGEEALLSAHVDSNVESSFRLYTNCQTTGPADFNENGETMSQNLEPFINGELTVERTRNGHKADYISPAAEVISVRHAQNMGELSEVIPSNQDKREIPSRKGRNRKDAKEPLEVSVNDQTQAVPPHKNTGELSEVIPSNQDKRERKIRKRKDAKEPLEPSLNDQTQAVPPHKNIGELSEVIPSNQDKREIPSRRGRKRKDAKEPLEVPLNDRTQAVPPHKSCKKREFSRRNSLAAAGTSWVAGKRTSNRIRVKPLEYWKGEKYVYGRVHESLATVIGIRYESQESSNHSFNEKRNFKVESYVSGEYEEVVKQRALY